MLHNLSASSTVEKLKNQLIYLWSDVTQLQVTIFPLPPVQCLVYPIMSLDMKIFARDKSNVSILLYRKMQPREVTIFAVAGRFPKSWICIPTITKEQCTNHTSVPHFAPTCAPTFHISRFIEDRSSALHGCQCQCIFNDFKTTIFSIKRIANLDPGNINFVHIATKKRQW
ncbi:hypothetical protein Dimus_038917 [Dionaea muscipula]